MKVLAGLALGLASLAAAAQTTTFNQTVHIHTALNHFTVIDPEEPITMFALADHSNFEIERTGDRLFLEPLKDNAATNLFIWTASRQLVYEIDPAGEVSKMDMLVRNSPPPGHAAAQHLGSATTDDESLQRLSRHILNDAFMRTEAIVNDDQKPHQGEVTIRVESVFRSKGELLIRFSVHNQSNDPFRITSLNVFEPHPTQTPVSILSLRDHQINEETVSVFKTTKGLPIGVAYAEVLDPNVAPGQTTVGVVTVQGDDLNPPRLYQLDFGTFQNHAVTAEVVL